MTELVDVALLLAATCGERARRRNSPADGPSFQNYHRVATANLRKSPPGASRANGKGSAIPGQIRTWGGGPLDPKKTQDSEP